LPIFDIVQIMTAGGPRNMTHVFATIRSCRHPFRRPAARVGDVAVHAAILAIAAVFILRGVEQARKGNWMSTATIGAPTPDRLWRASLIRNWRRRYCGVLSNFPSALAHRQNEDRGDRQIAA